MSNFFLVRNLCPKSTHPKTLLVCKESAKKHTNSLMLFTSSSDINPFTMFCNLISKVLSCYIVVSILSNFPPRIYILSS